MVLDPFAKRGAFLLAAKKLGRNGIGYEENATLAEEAFANGVSRG
jgi:DNA modification methylase